MDLSPGTWTRPAARAAGTIVMESAGARSITSHYSIHHLDRCDYRLETTPPPGNYVANHADGTLVCIHSRAPRDRCCHPFCCAPNNRPQAAAVRMMKRGGTV